MSLAGGTCSLFCSFYQTHHCKREEFHFKNLVDSTKDLKKKIYKIFTCE